LAQLLSWSVLPLIGLASAIDAAPRRGQADLAKQVVDAPPLPPPRPAELGGRSEEDPAAAQGETTSAIPAPPSRPDDVALPPTPASIIQEPPDEADHRACLERLSALKVKAERAPPIRDGACGSERPVRVSSLADGLAVSAPATVTCPVAEALAHWAQEVVKAEADRTLQSAPVSIQIGTSYECRNQNRQKTGKLSEHAFANAVDVMGFVFEKRPSVTVGFLAEGTPEANFLKAVRAGACAHFTTVLGPGSDAAHADHLHLDLRGRKGAMRLCQ
jgi:hypothetical protein